MVRGLTALALLAFAATASGEPRRHALYTLSDSEYAEALAVTLLPYLEQSYAALFPGPRPTQSMPPYLYRCYPATGNCVGFTANDIYALGPVVGNLTTPVWVSAMADFCNAHPAACGLKLPRQVVIGGLTRHYIVHLPWRVRSQSNVPVVFMLHGTSGTGDEFYNHSGWREKADAEGFVAVFPTALRHCFFEDENADGDFDDAGELKTPTKWADSLLGDPTDKPLCTAQQMAALPADVRAAVDHPLADDVAFFRAMVADVTASFAADPKRIYVSGFSNGGQMTHRLAHDASDLIAAAAANAGLVPRGFGSAAPRPMSMIFMVGETDDRYMPFAGGPLPLSDIGTLPGYQTFLRGFFETLQIANTPYAWQQQTLYGQLMSTYDYRTSSAAPPASNTFRVAIVQGLTHRYPEYMPDALWTFFRDQRLP